MHPEVNKRKSTHAIPTKTNYKKWRRSTMPYLHGKLEHPLSAQLTAEVHVYYATESEVEAILVSYIISSSLSVSPFGV